MSTARAGWLLAVLALLTGCVQMPSEGPVVEPRVSDTIDDVPGISFDPRPPQAGDSPADIVAGFLEAMKATPIRTTVAGQFLSEEAADAWVPEQQIITYAELGTAVGETSVRVPLSEVNRYDARGAWERTQAESALELGLALEEGEWRIDELPNALVVPESWFDDAYQRVSLYFFDPTAQVLVPEPVFVPSGEQFASSLVRGSRRCRTTPRPTWCRPTSRPAARRASRSRSAARASPPSPSPATRTPSTTRPRSGCWPSSCGRCARSRASGPWS